MPHGLLKDFRSIIAPLTANLLGRAKAYVIAYAQKKVYAYINYLLQQCPPPDVLKKMGLILEKIKKLIEQYDKKVKFASNLPKKLDPAIKAGKVVVEILSHLPVPSAVPPGIGIPIGIIQAQSNLLVFLRKMIETLEQDITNVGTLIQQLNGSFNPLLAKLSMIEGVMARCAETPDIYGGSGYTWGKLSGSSAALATLDLNESGSSPLFPQNTIVVDDEGYILSSVVTGSFIDTTNKVTTNTNVLIDRPDLTATAILSIRGSNTTGNILIGNISTGVNTNLSIGSNSNGTIRGGAGIGLSDTGLGATGISGAPNNLTGLRSTGIGGGSIQDPINEVVGVAGINLQQGISTSTGTFLPNNESTTGGAQVTSDSTIGNGTDGFTNNGILISGTGIGNIKSGQPEPSSSPGSLPTGTGVFIDGTEVGFTPEGRVAMINSVETTTKTAPAKEITYKSVNGKTYSLSIEEDTTQDYIAPRRYAVARDQRGLVILQGPKSYASSTQVLLDELKLRIDNQLP